MSELKPRIHDEQTGLDYILVGDYYIPAIELLEGDDRPIGKWGWMHKAYLEKSNPLLFNHLILTGKLHTYLADLNEQAHNRYRLIVRQDRKSTRLNSSQKRRSQWDWIRAMNGIVSRAEEIIRDELCNA